MEIDDRVEPVVRAVLDAAVHHDSVRFEVALQGFADDASTRKGVELALAICAFVLFDLHDGKPSADQVRELAEEISQQEAWMEPTADEVDAFLTALVNGAPMKDVLPAESVIVLSYLVAANLLASSSNTDEGEWWFNYLDKVEAAIEATPDRT